MKIICIGRNYIDHAKELKNPVPEEPVFFLKPDSALLKRGQPFFYPDFSKEIHYEVELVVMINRLGKNIAEKFAHKYYKNIGIGIDFTARDLQRECKEKRISWEKAKAFDGSAPVGKFLPLQQFKTPGNIAFSLKKNGKTVQHGTSADMVFSVEHIIAYVSKFMTLKIGDLIFTGTPAGVGEVKVGDTLEGFVEDDKMLEVRVK